MDDLLAEFVAETREMLEASEGELITWEADPSDHSRLGAIFRFVHTVKGNSGFFDVPQLEKLSHAAEDALAEVRVGKRYAKPKCGPMTPNGNPGITGSGIKAYANHLINSDITLKRNFDRRSES